MADKVDHTWAILAVSCKPSLFGKDSVESSNSSHNETLNPGNPFTLKVKNVAELNLGKESSTPDTLTQINPAIFSFLARLNCYSSSHGELVKYR